jgi:heme-degrading monooxygenase HmoA
VKLRSLLALPPLAALAACAVSTPFRWSRPLQESGEVLLVVTFAEVDPAQRARVDEQTAAVSRSMESAPGLLGWSIRKELFGDRVWTATVWRTEEDLAAFSRSFEHRRARAVGSSALLSMRSARAWLPAQSLPIRWSAALGVLDGSGAQGPGRDPGERDAAGSR